MRQGYYEKSRTFSMGGITGPQKMHTGVSMLRKVFGKHDRIKVADLGGSNQSFKLIKSGFPLSDVWSANLAAEEIDACPRPVIEDFSEKSSLPSCFFDLVVFTDVVEHLVEPDKVVTEIHRMLKENRFLFLTTPNLASWVNRFSLLLGFAPPNYHPSERRHGTLFGVKQSSWHKSVFTFGALKGFLEEYGFKVLQTKGFSYHDKRLFRRLGCCLPTSLGEGLAVLAQKTGSGYWRDWDAKIAERFEDANYIKRRQHAIGGRVVS